MTDNRVTAINNISIISITTISINIIIIVAVCSSVSVEALTLSLCSEIPSFDVGMEILLVDVEVVSLETSPGDVGVDLFRGGKIMSSVILVSPVVVVLMTSVFSSA